MIEVRKNVDEFGVKDFKEAFKVKVLNVNTLNTKPKDRRVGKYMGQTKTYKKAVITLKEGHKIEL